MKAAKDFLKDPLGERWNTDVPLQFLITAVRLRLLAEIGANFVDSKSAAKLE